MTDSRLQLLAERSGVPIETAAGQHAVEDGGTGNWRHFKFLRRDGRPGGAQEHESDAPVGAGILRERHHGQYGRPWLLGRYVFDHLLASGLEPQHALLDIGCGALRVGIHVIRYLEQGRYFGVDAHLRSLEAAVTYELPLHGLEDKRPRLLWNSEYAFDHFGVQFDWLIDVSTSLHIPEEDLETFFTRAAGVLRPGGRLLVSPQLRAEGALLARAGLRLNGEETQRCPLLEGHDFDPSLHWYALERV